MTVKLNKDWLDAKKSLLSSSLCTLNSYHIPVPVPVGVTYTVSFSLSFSQRNTLILLFNLSTCLTYSN
jgi:hypothetical protein